MIDQSTRFRNSWFLGAICEHAEAVLEGHLRRLVVTCPSGTLKSIIWCVAFPAWTWIDRPQVRFLYAANDQVNSTRDSTYCRNLIRSDFYQRTFTPDWRLSGDQDVKTYYSNTATGHRQVVSTGSTVQGKKGHILVTDDLHDIRDMASETKRDSDKLWFRQSFYDRMMNFKTSAVVVVGTRVDYADLPGELISEGWPELRLPERMDASVRKTFPVAVESVGREDPRADGELLRPERFGPEEEADAIQTFGQRVYNAKHQQKPERTTGRLFDRARVRLVSAIPTGTEAVRYWDTAATTNETSCYSSGVLLGRTPEKRYLVCNVRRDRWTAPDRNRVMLLTCNLDTYRPGIILKKTYFEKGAADSGVERDQYLIDFLSGFSVEADPARGDKIVRAEPFASQWAAGNVDVLLADWTEAYLKEMEDFPSRRFKDSVDATSGAFNRLVTYLPQFVPATAEAEDTAYGSLPPDTWE